MLQAYAYQRELKLLTICYDQALIITWCYPTWALIYLFHSFIFFIFINFFFLDLVRPFLDLVRPNVHPLPVSTNRTKVLNSETSSREVGY